MKVQKLFAAVLALALLSLAVACGGGAAAPTSAPATSAAQQPAATSAPAATNAPAATSAPAGTSAPGPTTAGSSSSPVDLTQALKATSGKKFPGVTLVVVSVSGDQGEFIGKVAKTWEDATGAKVQLNLFPFTDLSDKVLSAVSTGAYIADVLNVPSYLDGDLVGGGFIEPMPADVKARLNYDDVLPLYQQQGDWGGTTYGYPWDGDVFSVYYRKDLFADTNNQQKFKAKYGYDLAVPKTWQQYQDIAQFFTGDWGDGKQHYGSVELVMRKNQGFHGFIGRATCYAKMPNDPAFFFDPDTMDARINNPGFVQALTDLVNILPYSPPDMPNFGFIENAQSFVGGVTAMDIQWPDIGPMSVDPKTSQVIGKVGFALEPGCTKTYDAKNKKWVDMPNINFAPYAAFGGWQNLVPKNAKSKEAAIDFAAYLGSPQVMELASLTGGSGVNPARKSTINDVNAWVKFGFPSAEDAKSYLDTLQAVQTSPNAVFQLRVPGYPQYQDFVELAISKALSKQATPQQALDEAAQSWNQLTDRLGRDKMKTIYRSSIGLK